MIKLLDILKEMRVNPPKLTPLQLANQKVRDYIRNGEIGNLNLIGTPIKSLPPGLKVGGDLDLEDTPITSLPSGLKVRGYLDLSDTLITSLPPDLEVGRGLFLYNTPITSLPPDLKVGGNLNLSYTPLSKSHTKKQIRQMAPGVEGNIYM